jgi:hypothetical protein
VSVRCQAQFREGLGAPELLVRTSAGALTPLSGPVLLPELHVGAGHSVIIHMRVRRLGQLQIAAQLTCTLVNVRGCLPSLRGPSILWTSLSTCQSEPRVHQLATPTLHTDV